MDITVLKLIAVVLSSFCLGFALANTLWVFRLNPSPKKRKNGDNKTSKSNGKGND